MSVPAAVLALMLVAAQIAPEADAPVGTAQRSPASAEASAPGDAIADVLKGADAPPAPQAVEGAGPGAAPAAQPQTAAPPPGLDFDPHTKLDGATLQVILGQRATVSFDSKGLPVLGPVEPGRLTAAHPRGAVTELYFPPAKDQLAVALDGSAEVKASVVKVWNSLDHAVDLTLVGLVLNGDKLTPVPLGVCPFAAGEIRAQSWPAPIVAIGVTRVRAAAEGALANPACKKGN